MVVQHDREMLLIFIYFLNIIEYPVDTKHWAGYHHKHMAHMEPAMPANTPH